MSQDNPRPAYRVETERLVVRCWSPADAPAVQESINENLDHLRPWMPWIAGEPESVAAKTRRLRAFRGKFDLGEDFFYGIFDAQDTQVIGGSGLHTRLGEHGLEIGYWIHKDHVGNGYATEAAAALTRVGLELHGVDRIEIHMDPENIASAGVPRKLGFGHEATLRRRIADSRGQLRDVMIWTLFRDQLAESPAAVAAAGIRAFDATGQRIL